MSDITLGLIVGFLGLVTMIAGTLWSRRQRMAVELTEPQEINVGITSGRLILQAGSDVMLTVPGERFEMAGEEFALMSDAVFAKMLMLQWIPVDDGRMINRDAILWITDRSTKEFYL